MTAEAPTTEHAEAADAEFEHPGLLYHDPDEYVKVTAAFVEEEVEAGNPALVAVPGANLVLLREALRDCGDAVTFADLAVAGRNPGRIIPELLLRFADAHRGHRIAVVGEPIWPGRTAVEYPACGLHEALMNAIFAGRDATVLCPYDATGLDQDRLRDAWLTHPVMITSGGRRPSPWYADPFTAAAFFNRPLPPVPPAAVTLPFSVVGELGLIRRFVTGHGRAAGLHPDALDDLVVAVNELAENTILHTPAGGTVALWCEDGVVVCQIDDTGQLTDPLAGRIPPPVTTEGGRGLLLANQLCDLVRMHAHPAGTSIRVHMALG
ncbi:sensor histidine kinase [Actinoplanes sp. NPDC023714]|uniref:sensor histidine kinase n=1 Tax=Actinoplanes sp. NPDC023714 TaxID=3154322 RepID=UPI0034065650